MASKKQTKKDKFARRNAALRPTASGLATAFPEKQTNHDALGIHVPNNLPGMPSASMAADQEAHPQGVAPGANPDNDWLTAPWGPIGGVDEIHGDGGKACPDFIPTRHELTLIARYWIERTAGVELDWFYYAMTGSAGIRLMPYAARRLKRIRDAIGDESLAIVELMADESLRKSIGDRAWKIFRKGTSAERKSFQEEVDASTRKENPMWRAAFNHVEKLASTEFADLPAAEFARALRAVANEIERDASK